MAVSRYPYRVFISYSHVDRIQVECLAEILADANLTPMWDRHLAPGVDFPDQIRSFITNAHVFLPFLTPASIKRPWLNQEIGYAAAMGKPILPVAVGVVPLGIITGVQAIQFGESLDDAAEKLSAECFARIADATKVQPATYECTDDNARRAQMLADYANGVSALEQYGRIRQRASLTTFHLPKHGPKHAIWKQYFAARPDDLFLFEALRSERIALEKHARSVGCRLILDPVESVEVVYKNHGPASAPERIRGLLAFLTDRTISDVVVAINDNPERKSSLTLVGDWFCSEAVSSAISSSGLNALKEAVFTRHHQTVRTEIDDFDLLMKDLLAAMGWDEGSSRSRAISYLEKYLERTGS
jgi:hypothetical protein